nr:MAG TPA: hypothetical protein [Caudoviricetes sp.]
MSKLDVLTQTRTDTLTAQCQTQSGSPLCA